MNKVCNNCMHYDGDHCTKDWNNMEPDWYRPDRDDREPDDSCDDWEEGEEDDTASADPAVHR